ncbi:hypothetical protein F5Y05DRAFT_403418 [Hypoxylon sp. FL0543]|nr:hypothetical protein F5Y05DRAFT_403418 [Hypoxylon sp. FL0543]
MQNPESRKYQLFPREKQLPPVTSGKQLDPEQAFAMAMGQTDKPSVASGLRMRIKEHNMTRRRKISVPDLGPMTTVQEVAMDSPTIPGRPALHERSISSPVNSWRQRHIPETGSSLKEIVDEMSEVSAPFENVQKSTSSALKQPLSPKDLAPLTIPTQSGPIPRLARQLSLSRLRNKDRDAQQESTIKSARTDESPRIRTTFTPASASATATTPMSATTNMTNSTLPTPVSAPAECRSSPKPWERLGSTTPVCGHMQPNGDPMATPKAEPETQTRTGTAMSHRRGNSESGSIMDRGRPRKRSDGTPIGGHKRSASKRSISAERRAFETLPQGWKSTEAVKALDASEVAYLQKQALGQALRFEVLKKDDVESLSKELRHLDERTEYLRRTYTSLRAGRRNLHSRICQYLRSPRVAKFSYESMLKQEETLAELDASIDDWVTKLEHAENRRTRVRQKLLEHVAAAATLSLYKDIAGTSEIIQQAMGVRLPSSDISTPPRSPTKRGASSQSQSPTLSPSSSPSPQRVVARVPSVIPELPAEEVEDASATRSRKNSTESTLQRMESIRIYADSDVYALLADVENEFTKLNGGVGSPESTNRPETEEQRRVLHRARSHDIITSGYSRGRDKTPPISPPAPTPPVKNSPREAGDVFLTAAVFQPDRPTVSG